MMKKLGIVVMAGLFSISVAGLSFADEKKAAAPAPAAPAAEKAAPAAAAGEKEMKPKKTKKAAKKAAPKVEAPAPMAAPAPAGK